MYEEIDDQAALVGGLFSLHLQQHGGKPDENCEFCKGFIIPSKKQVENNYPLESYKFLILDVSEK